MTRERTTPWASRSGVLLVLLGVLSAAWYGNEWMKVLIVGDMPFTVQDMPRPACDADELIEEGLSMAACQQMALSVHDLSVSRGPWFRQLYAALSALGLSASLIAIVAGMALLDERPRGAAWAMLALVVLMTVDLAEFVAVVASGPLLRQQYLWPLLSLLLIYLFLFVGLWVDREADISAEYPDSAPG